MTGTGGRGRPPGDPAQRKTARLFLRLTATTHAAYSAAAARAGLSLSDWARARLGACALPATSTPDAPRVQGDHRPTPQQADD